MKSRSAALAIAILTVASGCGQQGGQYVRKVPAKLNTFDVSEPENAARSSPQIAYTYTLSYQLRSADLAAVQAQQLGACRGLGPRRCLVLKSSTSSGEGGTAAGNASMVVDARLASAFNRRLDAIAAGADGIVADRSVEAEDVTKELIDTGARVRAKEALAARLLALIGSARGNVGELVAAEKAYADTQEQLDAANSLQVELSRRVAMSRIDISYVGRESRGALAPLRVALASAGETLGMSLGALVTAIVALFPWLFVVLALRWIARRFGWRGPLTRLRDWRARRAPAD